jgi:DNA-binding transcriptional MerR regulator
MPKNSNRSTRKTSSGEVVIPDKIYFRIGEVSRLCRLPSYVLRFWETEFPHLKPSKSGTGQRMYRRPDVENVLRIKKLLYEEGFTIAGARQYLRSENKKKQPALPFAPSGTGAAQLKQVRQGLKDILGLLSPRK